MAQPVGKACGSPIKYGAPMYQIYPNHNLSWVLYSETLAPSNGPFSVPKCCGPQSTKARKGKDNIGELICGI